jgi:hypothetical protein
MSEHLLLLLYPPSLNFVLYQKIREVNVIKVRLKKKVNEKIKNMQITNNLII